jgi:RNA polymerase primary sigma factor
MAMTSCKPITREEELELIRRIKENDDEKAKNKLVCAHIKFVVSIAKQYQNRGLEFVDLVSEGSLGLIRAIDRFDKSRGLKFLTYAVWWIKEAIQTALINNRLISIPVKKQTLIKKFRSALAKNGNDFEKTISMIEFAEFKHDIHEIMSKTEVSSLDTPVENSSDNDKVTLADMISADPSRIVPIEKTISYEVRSIVSDMFPKVLNERELGIVKLSYGIDCREHTNEEIGCKIGITGERVRQIKLKAYGKILKDAETRKALYSILKD